MKDAAIDAAIAAWSNWGRWGADDELGTVNLISEAKRIEAATLVRTGRTFSLAIPLDRDGPQPPGNERVNPVHVMLATGTDLLAGVQPGSIDGWGYADDMVAMALQCATQWDGLSHAFYDYRMYNDRPCADVTSAGAASNSITALGARVVTRGVLVDMPRYKGVAWLEPGYEVTPDDLDGALVSQGVSVGAGDALLIRTGNLRRAREAGTWRVFTHSDEPGVGLAGLGWMRLHDIAAAAADTWAFEVLPSRSTIMLPVHAVGIVHVGLLVGEIFDLDALAQDCATDGTYEFLFSAPPLPVTGAVGSPIVPIAIK